jgi:hypothetical protein
MIILFISSLFLNGHIFEIAKIIFRNFYHENLDTNFGYHVKPWVTKS